MIIFSDQKPTGVWSSQLETDYLKKWSERLASDWLAKMEDLTVVRTHSPIPDSQRWRIGQLTQWQISPSCRPGVSCSQHAPTCWAAFLPHHGCLTMTSGRFGSFTTFDLKFPLWLPGAGHHHRVHIPSHCQAPRRDLGREAGRPLGWHGPALLPGRHNQFSVEEAGKTVFESLQPSELKPAALGRGGQGVRCSGCFWMASSSSRVHRRRHLPLSLPRPWGHGHHRSRRPQRLEARVPDVAATSLPCWGGRFIISIIVTRSNVEHLVRSPASKNSSRQTRKYFQQWTSSCLASRWWLRWTKIILNRGRSWGWNLFSKVEDRASLGARLGLTTVPSLVFFDTSSTEEDVNINQKLIETIVRWDRLLFSIYFAAWKYIS